jgi:tripartite ATP-independent transporter DctP family solute receptor
MRRFAPYFAVVVISLCAVVASVGVAGAQEKKIVAKFGDILPPEHPNTKAYYYFAEKVKERTKGRVEVEVYHSGQLGQAKDLLIGLQTGAIEMAKVSLAFVGEWVPEVKVFDLPYLFNDHEGVWRTFRSPAGSRFFTDIFPRQNLVGIMWVDEGKRSIYANKPVRKPEDLKGLKIRVEPSDIRIQSMNAMGAIATTTAYGEIYMAIQQRVVDGAENVPVAVLASKHYEVAKVYSMTEHFWLIATAFASKKWWDGLPKDVQAQIGEAAQDAERHMYETYVAAENQAIGALKERGEQIITDVDKAAFAARVQPVYDGFVKKYGNQVLEQVRGAIKAQ